MKQYGHFDEEGRFIIKDPYTPEPWLHYLIRVDQPGTETFASGVTYAGGGFDVRGTHENTIVDARLHLNDHDDVGRYLYIYDRSRDLLWSSFWQPVRHPEQRYQVTLDFGYLKAEAECGGVRCTTTMFVPRAFDGWIQDIQLENRTDKVLQLELYPLVPIHLGDALARLLAGDNDAFFGGASYDPELKGIVFRRHQGIAVNDDSEKIKGLLGNLAFYYCTLNQMPDWQVAYDTTLERFLGDRFHTLACPGAIKEGRLACKDTPYLRRACGVFRHLIELKPGEGKRLAVALIVSSTQDYYLNNKHQLKQQIAQVNASAQRDAQLEAVKAWWQEYMSRISLQTPDPKVNRAFRWLQYQCQIVYVLNRMKSRFHTGYEYGWGFRDILQDVLFILPYEPKAMRQALLHIATQMFASGQAYHNFFINQPGNKNIEASDDPLWLPAAVVKYCKETGDFSILDEVIDYADVKEGQPNVRGSLLEHCQKALARVLKDRSPQGLPYLKDCDWNDDLNQPRQEGQWSKEYESVMVAQQLYRVLLDMAELLEVAGKGNQLSLQYRQQAQELKEVILKRALDKAGYFKRLLSVSGDKNTELGSSEQRYAQIFLEPQIFAVLAGLLDEEMTARILKAVKEHLDTDFGAMLCYPFFTELAWENRLPDQNWNIAKEPPGMKENGGIFMHLNAWLIQAYCLAGWGKEAVALYRKTLPENMASDQTNYGCEPYVYPEYVRGKDADQFGRGGHTWLTGTAPTMHTAVLEYICGLKPDYQGLILKPCLDPSWSKITVVRNFRGARYAINIINPEGKERGLKEVRVDGLAVKLARTDEVVLPIFNDGKLHEIEAIMG